MRKKIAGFMVAVMVGFSFAGCSTGDSEQPTATVTVTAEPTPETPEAPMGSVSDEMFADLIRQNTNAFDNASDQQIVKAAEAGCSYFDEGATFEQAAMVIVESGVDVYDGGFLLGAGVANYCPEYTDLLPSGAGSTV